jgi:hypothetical protein
MKPLLFSCLIFIQLFDNKAVFMVESASMDKKLKTTSKKKAVFSGKKKRIVKEVTPIKSVSKPGPKRMVSPEVAMAYERAKWTREKRGYWSSRFRRMLISLSIKPKAKKRPPFASLSASGGGKSTSR